MTGTIKKAQEDLDGYVSNLGTKSIRVAIAGDRTLAGQAHVVFFEPWSRPDVEPINNSEFLGQRLPIVVWAS